jgi:hypothetical protein
MGLPAPPSLLVHREKKQMAKQIRVIKTLPDGREKVVLTCGRREAAESYLRMAALLNLDGASYRIEESDDSDGD